MFSKLVLMLPPNSPVFCASDFTPFHVDLSLRQNDCAFAACADCTAASCTAFDSFNKAAIDSEEASAAKLRLAPGTVVSFNNLEASAYAFAASVVFPVLYNS